MRVAHDRHIHDVRGSLPGGIDLVPFDPRHGPSTAVAASDRDPAQIRTLLECDALLIRTVTRITPEAFPELDSPGRRLSFIGTATAGIDHVDADWLASLGIRFAHSPGCNAMAVAEYAATALLAWLDRETGHEADRTWSSELIRGMNVNVGILGAGHAGGAAANLLRSLGFEVACYDPPKSMREPSFRSCSWDEIEACDVISLHVPLTRSGEDATSGWITPGLLASMRTRLVIQASRGGVLIESDATDLVCDVWEHEPVFSDDTIRRSFLATPHIAGYSLESKQRATRGVCDALLRHAGMDPAGVGHGGSQGVGRATGLDAFAEERSAAGAGHAAGPSTAHRGDDRLDIPSDAASLPETLTDALMRLHPIRSYDRALRSCAGMDPRQKSACFSSIRDTFPLRREYSSLRVGREWLNRLPILADLGIGAIGPGGGVTE